MTFREDGAAALERAARLLGLETRKVPLDDEFRLDADALDLTDATALVATVGTTSTTASIPCLPLRTRAKRRASGSVPSCAGRRRVWSARTHSS